ncbi:MAG: penicillin acylase family protein [Gemmatimonadales bacterium]
MSRAKGPAYLFALLTLVWVGAQGVGPVPPLGPFLDPVAGVWAAATHAEHPRESSVTLPGLSAPVEVVYDDRAVPHVFASSEADVITALGYVIARDRLFQVELQTRAAAGRLTELVGPSALDFDRNSRRLDLAASADRLWHSGRLDPDIVRLLQAYARGVNSFIEQLTPARLPLEYKLLGATPMPYEPVHGLYFWKQMGWTLAGFSHDLRHVRVAELVGERAARALFPPHSPIREPIEPIPFAPLRNFRALPPPELSETDDDREGAMITALGTLAPSRRANASNNWTVAPQRTATGNALLAGDPHLDLTLPSTWFEVHLVVHDSLDAYGVTFPGLPFVAIGFNRSVAWSFTNTGADVMDFYRETLDDSISPANYRLDGEWVPLTSRVEAYVGSDGDTLAVDTLLYTHRGPMTVHEDIALSMRWTVLEASTIPTAFRRIMYATDVDSWVEAMSGFDAPAQNGVVADTAGSIGLFSFGSYPIRPGNGDGLVIRDGTSSASDWIGYWGQGQGAGELPGAVNPTQGYMASANQEPVDPTRESRYLGVDWVAPWRAMRINRLLRSDANVTVDEMRQFQTDPGSERVAELLPPILNALEAAELDDRSRQGLSMLTRWDRRYVAASEGAVLFEYLIRQISARLWDELVPPDGSRRAATPSEAILAQLLSDSGSVWWDDRRTPETESMGRILRGALEGAVDAVILRFGPPEGGGWKWANVGLANIPHLIRAPSLSVMGVPVQAGIGTLGAWSWSGSHGPSWRMVVELGDPVTAWVTYPGGQSGNPFSQYYDDRIDEWAEGELSEVVMPRSADELDSDRRIATLHLGVEE